MTGISSYWRGKMQSGKINGIFLLVFVMAVMTFCVIPAYAENGTVSITLRGEAGYNVGDIIAFDGLNTVSNMTVVKITGPGLPAEGVPPYNLTDVPGTGNTAETDAKGHWVFYWYTNRATGIETMLNGRYTITAYDRNHQEINASSIISLRQTEFYAAMTPNPAVMNQYVQVTGVAEKGVSTIEIAVTDSSGKKLHTFTSPVTSGGNFNYGFHVDMPPGRYTVTIGSPSLENRITKMLIVTEPVTVTATPEVTSQTPVTTLPVTNETTVPATSAVTPTITQTVTLQETGTLIISSNPADATVYLDSVMVGKTPLKLTSVPSGSHLVEIKSPGYLTCSINVIISENKPTEIAPEMVKSSIDVPLSPLTPIAGCIAAAVLILISGQRKR